MKFEYRPQKGVPGNCFMAQVFDTESGRAIATINTTADEAKATGYARLLAAAPELLEAVKVALGYMELCGGDTWELSQQRKDDLFSRLEKAITKAEGDEPNNP